MVMGIFLILPHVSMRISLGEKRKGWVDEMKKSCGRYVGVACVDGTCPMANSEEYEERCVPLVKNCEECYCNKGCEDCAMKGTEYCEESGKK